MKCWVSNEVLVIVGLELFYNQELGLPEVASCECVCARCMLGMILVPSPAEKQAVPGAFPCRERIKMMTAAC